MTTVTRFEELIAWQKARALTRIVYVITRQGEFARDWGLSRQIQRAAVSIMSNIAEEVGRIIGGLHLAVIKQREQPRKNRL